MLLNTSSKSSNTRTKGINILNNVFFLNVHDAVHFIHSHKYNTNSAEDSSDMNWILYSEHNLYVFVLVKVRTPITCVRVHHANHCTTKAHYY